MTIAEAREVVDRMIRVGWELEAEEVSALQVAADVLDDVLHGDLSKYS